MFFHLLFFFIIFEEEEEEILACLIALALFRLLRSGSETIPVLRDIARQPSLDKPFPDLSLAFFI